MKIKEIKVIDLKKILIFSVKKAFEVNGDEMNELKFVNLIDNLIEGLQRKFGLMEIEDIKIAITNGIYGEYGQWNRVSVKNMLNWVRIKWDEIKQKKQFEDDNAYKEIVNLRETPFGQAIIWKMKFISLDDWDRIPLKEIAIAIKEGVNMNKFALDYGIELEKSNKDETFEDFKTKRDKIYKKNKKL